MYPKTTIISALSASLAAAAPSAMPAIRSAITARDGWTIMSMVRTCNADDTTCTWDFTIDMHTADLTPCSFTVVGQPASHTGQAAPVTCGDFEVTTG